MQGFLAYSDAEHIGTIFCFLVEPSMRGRGVASQLLAAPCDGLRAQGLHINALTDGLHPSAVGAGLPAHVQFAHRFHVVEPAHR